MEYTLSIIKPDATKRNITGIINSYFEKSGLSIVAQKRIRLTIDQAKKFYLIHKDQPFYNDLIKFMVSGPVIVQVLKGQNAVAKNREVIGATNPIEAVKKTIRADHAIDIEQNSVHGSDSLESAKNEIKFFFSETEIIE